jgi:cis-3-alkyl-4-acyloxetan-2-one decarboxylase
VLCELENKLPRLAEKPISMVWGMKDWCFRPECMERLAKAWPSAKKIELADVGHYVMEEAPGEVESVIRDLIA